MLCHFLYDVKELLLFLIVFKRRSVRILYFKSKKLFFFQYSGHLLKMIKRCLVFLLQFSEKKEERGEEGNTFKRADFMNDIRKSLRICMS